MATEICHRGVGPGGALAHPAVAFLSDRYAQS